MNSALYFGALAHRRQAPVEHAFRYRVWQAYLDLDELPRVFAGRWLWSSARPNLARFRRADYLGDARRPLALCAREEVERQLGLRLQGPVRLLTQLRQWGLCFNPVSFYFCFEADGQTLAAVLAEITNTPWNERFVYALPRAGAGPGVHAHSAKRFHVSPFLPMGLEYEWSVGLPGEQLAIGMRVSERGALRFAAELELERAPIDARHCARALATGACMPARVLGAIYWQALRLALKRAPFHTHPRKLRELRT